MALKQYMKWHVNGRNLILWDLVKRRNFDHTVKSYMLK